MDWKTETEKQFIVKKDLLHILQSYYLGMLHKQLCYFSRKDKPHPFKFVWTVWQETARFCQQNIACTSFLLSSDFFLLCLLDPLTSAEIFCKGWLWQHAVTHLACLSAPLKAVCCCQTLRMRDTNRLLSSESGEHTCAQTHTHCYPLWLLSSLASSLIPIVSYNQRCPRCTIECTLVALCKHVRLHIDSIYLIQRLII